MPLLTKPAAFQANTAALNYFDASRPGASSWYQYTAGIQERERLQKHAQEVAEYEAQQRELTRRMGEIDREEQDNIAAGNSQSNSRLNSAALASARRKAGGATFRRKGSAVTPNSLVSGLGTANAKALANARRATATNEVAEGIGWRANISASATSAPQQNHGGFTVGAPVAFRYN